MTKLYKCGKQTTWLWFVILLLSFAVVAQESEDDDFISPNRPTNSVSATIQKAGVLQVETGGNFDFDQPDFRNQQNAGFNFTLRQPTVSDWISNLLLQLLKQTAWASVKPDSATLI